jgi:predicted XRE-type DNA-binding protein
MSAAPATKYYFRQRQQNRLYDVVIRAIEEEHIRRKNIAEKLGIPPSQVTRLLSGPANWTIDTISDLLFAIDAELDFSIVRFRDRVKGNRFHLAGEPSSPAPMITVANHETTVTTGTTASGAVTVINLTPQDPTRPASNWVIPAGMWPNA